MLKLSNKKTKRNLLILLVVVLLFGLYSSDRFMFDFLNYVDEKTNRVLRINGVRNQVFKLVDELTFWGQNKKIINSDLLEVKIEMSSNDLQYFESALKEAVKNGGHLLPPESLDKKKVDVIYSGKKYEARIGLHGDAYNHYAFYKKSFKVEFDELEMPERFKEWRLLIPDDRAYLSPLMANYLNELLGLPVIDNKFAKVYINNIFYGIYYLEEKYDERYLEKNKLSSHLVIKFDNSKVKDREVIDNYNIEELDSLVIDELAYYSEQDVLNVIGVFFQALNEYDYEKIKSYLDKEKIAAFEAWRVLLGKKHDITVGNLRFVYNLSNGKFFLLPRLESSLYGTEGNYYIDDNLYKFIREDPDVLRIRDNKLSEIISKKEDVLNKYDELYNSYYDLIMADNTISRAARLRKRTIQDNLIDLENNLNYWQNYLSETIVADEKLEDQQLSNSLFVSPLYFYRSGEEFILPAGDYYINQDLFLPAGYNLVFSPGVRLFLGEGISVVSYSKIDIRGGMDSMVYIAKQPGVNSFGVFAIQGVDESNCLSKIDYLDISGGSEGFVNGVFYNGGLNIYYCDLVMRNSFVHDHLADDGLNVKNGTVVLTNNIFKDNAIDQVDLDYCTGEVMNNSFMVMTGDGNGDGLDVSGSKISILNNVFRNFTDKGLSIGEESLVHILANNFGNNNMGVAIKDLSEVYVDKNVFFGNIVDINLYQKKYIFGGGFGLIKGKNTDGLLVENDDLSVVGYKEGDVFDNIVKREFYGN